MRTGGLVALQLREDEPLLASQRALNDAVDTGLGMVGLDKLRKRPAPLAAPAKDRGGVPGLRQTANLRPGRHVAALHLLRGDHVHQRAVENLRRQHRNSALGTVLLDVGVGRASGPTQTIGAVEVAVLARRGRLIEDPEANVAEEAGIERLIYEEGCVEAHDEAAAARLDNDDASTITTLGLIRSNLLEQIRAAGWMVDTRIRGRPSWLTSKNERLQLTTQRNIVFTNEFMSTRALRVNGPPRFPVCGLLCRTWYNVP